MNETFERGVERGFAVEAAVVGHLENALLRVAGDVRFRVFDPTTVDELVKIAFLVLVDQLRQAPGVDAA